MKSQIIFALFFNCSLVEKIYYAGALQSLGKPKKNSSQWLGASNWRNERKPEGEKAREHIFAFLENLALRLLFHLRFMIFTYFYQSDYPTLCYFRVSSYFYSFPTSFIESSCKGVPALFF
jgi:hypothetical protein